MLLRNINYLFLYYENICLLSDLSTSMPKVVLLDLVFRLGVINRCYIWRKTHTHTLKKHKLFACFVVWRCFLVLVFLLLFCFCFWFVSLLLWDFSGQPTYKCMQSSLIILLYRNNSLNSINMLHYLITTEHFLWLLVYHLRQIWTIDRCVPLMEYELLEED